MLPTFSEDGSLLGFQVRADLAIMLFIQSEYELLPVKRVVRLILQMNRMLREGHATDFIVQEARKTSYGNQAPPQAMLVDATPI
jgi:hypothetical protein